MSESREVSALKRCVSEMRTVGFPLGYEHSRSYAQTLCGVINCAEAILCDLDPSRPYPHAMSKRGMAVTLSPDDLDWRKQQNAAPAPDSMRDA